MELPGVQIKMATKIHQAIQKAMTKPELYQIMVASNVFGRGFGERKIKALLAQEPNVMDWDTKTNFAGLTTRICQIDGFDTKTAGQFASKLEKFKLFLQTLPPSLVADIVYPKGSNKSMSSSSSSTSSGTSSSL